MNGIKDYKIELQNYQIAAAQGDINAQNELGIIYENGYGVEQSYTTAIEWYTKAANQNNIAANYNLGEIYYNGKGVRKDYELAFHYYKTAANQEYSDAQIQLAGIYYQGLEVERDHDNIYAIISLGEIYHSINNENQNFSKAFECYENTNEDDMNKSYALRGIGLLYEHGDGVERNYEKAFEYYRQSVDRKNKGAYYNLALLYYYGKGVDKNFSIALEWFNRVIKEEPEEGNTHVFVQIENHTEYDISTEKQRKYSMVSERVIYGEAHYYLGLMYKEGQYTDKNYEKAMDYFKIAHTFGAERVKKYLD